MADRELCIANDADRHCVLTAGHDGAHVFPLTLREQLGRYEEQKAAFDRDFAAWDAGGRVGPPPPHPVRPHAPGWAPPVERAVWSEGLEIRQLTLKEEEKTGATGLIVTALRKCEKGKGRTLLLNTPYMSEPPEGYNGDGEGYLADTVMELINEAEFQAQLYREGERGEQTSLELGDSENTKQVNDRMAAAEVASTRKPKGRGKGKGKVLDFVPGTGQVMNPEATEVLAEDDAQIRQLLLSVERDVPLDAIKQWTSSDRSQAIAWAEARQKELLELLKSDQTVPREPECLIKHATLPLSAEQWHAARPPKAADVEPVRA